MKNKFKIEFYIYGPSDNEVVIMLLCYNESIKQNTLHRISGIFYFKNLQQKIEF